jgi:hypothetical protein
LTQTPTDRWFYFSMAVLFLLVALIGFIPRTIAVATGALRNPPVIVHVHAVLMGMWLVLFATQTGLVATNRRDVHRRLGVSALVLTPFMWVAMVATAISWHRYMAGINADLGAFGSNMLLSFLRSIVLFPIFFSLAMMARKTDSETHKRMMILATLVLASGGIDRMGWLPGQILPRSYDGTHTYQLLLFLPALIHDLWKRGSLHRAYVLGLALLLPWMIATHFLWGSEWWQSVASRLMGVT